MATPFSAVKAQSTSIECLSTICQVYSSRPCVGQRALSVAALRQAQGDTGDSKGDSSAISLPQLPWVVSLENRYRYISYAQFWTAICRLSTYAFQRSGTSSGPANALLGARQFVGICGYGSIEYSLAIGACMHANHCFVPLQTNLSTVDLSHIFVEAELSTVFVSLEYLSAVLAVIDAVSRHSGGLASGKPPQKPSGACTVRRVIVMDLPVSSPPSRAPAIDGVEALSDVSEFFGDVSSSPAFTYYSEYRQRIQQQHPEIAVTHLQQYLDSSHSTVPTAAVTTTAIQDSLPSSQPLQSHPDVGPFRKASADDLMLLLYTSGSTGYPKAAMFPERLWCKEWRKGSDRGDRAPPIVYCFLPLAHRGGLNNLTMTLRVGGSLSFLSQSDMSTLFDDVRIVRPTGLTLVPRISTMIYSHFQSEVAHRYKLALQAAPSSPPEPSSPGTPDKDTLVTLRARLEREVMEDMRKTFLGDRLQALTSSTAPTSAAITVFLKQCFQVPVVDAYGATENGSVLRGNKIDHKNVSAFKLVDVPDLGYLTSDKPFPRGELLLKCDTLIPGYYKNPKATAALFDEDGFMRTGDIMEQRGPDEFHYVDRRNNILKLSQGEFVSITRLETLFTTHCSTIKQIYLYGHSLRSYLVAVVVPRAALSGDQHQAAELRRSIRLNLLQVARQQQLRPYEIPRDFLMDPEPFSKENGLLTESNKPSRPRLLARYGARLDALYAQLDAQQEAQFNQLLNRAAPSIPSVSDGSSQSPPTESKVTSSDDVMQALQAVLGVSDEDLRPLLDTHSFTAVGGDSVAAVKLVNLLREMLNVAVPVGLVLDKSAPLQRVFAYVQAALKGHADTAQRGQTLYHRVHGDHGTGVVDGATNVMQSSQLTVESFVEPHEWKLWSQHLRGNSMPYNADYRSAAVDEAISGLASATVQAEHVLLTGANGFLGRFLLLELLLQLPASSRVTVLVRAPSNALAWERLVEGYRTQSALMQLFARLAGVALTTSGSSVVQPPPRDARVTVLAGDLSHPMFGLSPGAYDQLVASRVDSVLHNGALVNHVFGYRELFEPNVLGTVEVIRFVLNCGCSNAVNAKARRTPAIAFLSTVAAVAGYRPATSTNGAAVVSERLLPSDLGSSRMMSGGYAVGYGASKWACELLLQQIAQQFGVPVLIFRSGMVLPPAGAIPRSLAVPSASFAAASTSIPQGDSANDMLLGQINAPDAFIRLIAGLVLSQSAPESFYAGGRQAAIQQQAQLDGIPVDDVAHVITAITLRCQPSITAQRLLVFHVIQPAQVQKPFSLDSLIDALRSAGYSLTLYSDYQQWYSSFVSRLEALPPSKRAQTAHPIASRWRNPQSQSTGALQRLLSSADYSTARQLISGLSSEPRVAGRPGDPSVVDQKYVHRVLRHMVVQGILPKADSSTAVSSQLAVATGAAVVLSSSGARINGQVDASALTESAAAASNTQNRPATARPKL